MNLKSRNNQFESTFSNFKNRQDLKSRKKDLSKQNRIQFFKIHDDLCSINIKEQCFTNMLRDLRDSKQNNIIKKILDLDGKSFEKECDIPFSLDEEQRLIVKTRHRKILSKYIQNIDTKNIMKFAYRDVAQQLLNCPAQNFTEASATRIYCIADEDNKNNKTIILIDPYHLFATERYIDNFNKCKGYNVCMLRLRK